MAYRIDWKSTSQWSGTEKTESEGDDIYETWEAAEEAMREFQKDSSLMEEVHDAAVEGQGVEGFLEIVEAA